VFLIIAIAKGVPQKERRTHGTGPATNYLFINGKQRCMFLGGICGCIISGWLYTAIFSLDKGNLAKCNQPHGAGVP
jgi:hypothetical protein